MNMARRLVQDITNAPSGEGGRSLPPFKFEGGVFRYGGWSQKPQFLVYSYGDLFEKMQTLFEFPGKCRHAFHVSPFGGPAGALPVFRSRRGGEYPCLQELPS